MVLDSNLVNSIGRTLGRLIVKEEGSVPTFYDFTEMDVHDIKALSDYNSIYGISYK